MNITLPQPLAKLNHYFLTHERYRVFWEMRLIEMILGGFAFNTLLFLYLEIASPQSIMSSLLHWPFRIISFIGLGVWIWSTYQYSIEKDSGQITSFHLRARLFIYFLGISIFCLPLELLNQDVLYEFFRYGNLFSLMNDWDEILVAHKSIINLYTIFHLSVFLSAMKILKITDLLSGFITFIPFAFISMVFLWLLIFSYHYRAMFLLTLALCALVGYFIYTLLIQKKRGILVMKILAFPYLVWALIHLISADSLIIHQTHTFNSETIIYPFILFFILNVIAYSKLINLLYTPMRARNIEPQP